MEQKQVAAEKQVLSKLEKIKLDQEQRAAALAKDAQAEELQVGLAPTRLIAECRVSSQRSGRNNFESRFITCRTVAQRILYRRTAPRGFKPVQSSEATLTALAGGFAHVGLRLGASHPE